jgi:N-acyl-L-homoserine lactone synthetase
MTRCELVHLYIGIANTTIVRFMRRLGMNSTRIHRVHCWCTTSATTAVLKRSTSWLQEMKSEMGSAADAENVVVAVCANKVTN